MDLEAVADALYGLPPGEFTAARNARAKEAKAAGDRDLADAIAALSRPTTSAWLVNLLVREHTAEIDGLLELGEALREAQAQLSGPELRELSTQRHRVVATLGQQARVLARDQGQRVSDAVERELESTLDAALADPAAADAVRSGRLTTALTYAGIGAVDLSGAVAAPKPTTSRRGRGKPRDRKTDRGAERAGAADRAAADRAAADRAGAEAQAALDDAQAVLEERETVFTQTRSAHEQMKQRLEELRRQVADAEAAESGAAHDVRRAREARDAARRHAQAAERRLAQAESARDRLG